MGEKLAPHQLPDGSLNYGNGVIGPSFEDQLLATQTYQQTVAEGQHLQTRQESIIKNLTSQGLVPVSSDSTLGRLLNFGISNQVTKLIPLRYVVLAATIIGLLAACKRLPETQSPQSGPTEPAGTIKPINSNQIFAEKPRGGVAGPAEAQKTREGLPPGFTKFSSRTFPYEAAVPSDWLAGSLGSIDNLAKIEEGDIIAVQVIVSAHPEKPWVKEFDDNYIKSLLAQLNSGVDIKGVEINPFVPGQRVLLISGMPRGWEPPAYTEHALFFKSVQGENRLWRIEFLLRNSSKTQKEQPKFREFLKSITFLP